MTETNTGIGDMLDFLAATASPTAYDTAHARLSVGDGNGSVPTPAATDTTLTASVNKFSQPVTAGYPQRAAQTLTYLASFGTSSANFAWNEWGLDNGNGGGPNHLFNHRGVGMGSKASGSTWSLTVTLTQS